MASIESDETLKIVLTAPYPAIRAGLRSLLMVDSRLEVLAECASPAEWSPFLSAASLLLIAPVGAISPGWWRLVRESAQGIPILLLLSQPLTTVPDFNGSTWGILPFSVNASQLTLAIRTLSTGLWVASLDLLPPLVSSEPADDLLDPSLASDKLTTRELEVLQYLAQGYTNKQIAQRIKISIHTIKFHVNSIYSKLGVNNRTEAARQGLRKGLINL